MPVHLHRSNRTESLVDALVEIVREPLDDPRTPECIVVQGRGMERWLAMQLAERLGIWANPSFPFPRRLVERALGPPGRLVDVFEPETLTWAVAAALPTHLGEAAFEPLARYLEPDRDSVRLLALAARIARTFDQYVVHRPGMVRAWEEGRDRHWQATLWRTLIARHGAAHVAARVGDLVRNASALAGPPGDLPRRVSLFGVATLPPLYLEVLAAMARVVDVHLFVLSASAEYWGEIRSRREIIRALARVGAEPPDAEERLHLVEGHPLLASLGRLGRDFQHVLEAGTDYLDDPTDRYVDPGTGSVLAALQSDMLFLRHRRPGDSENPPLPLAADDHSIGIHACHGPMREVEVLRDHLLDLFEHDPTLQPHHVIVMSPAITAYAPFIDAVFGGTAGEAPTIPYQIADRGMQATDEAYDALCRILDSLSRRCTASEVMDLLELASVRARFEIDTGEIELARRWVTGAGIHWGIDEEHRTTLAYPSIREHTWRFGLDRLLLGQAMMSAGGTTLFGGVLPFDDVDGSEAPLLGRLATFCERLFELHDRLRAPRPPAAWATDLGVALAVMLDDRGPAAEQHRRIRAGLATVAEEAARAGFDRPIGLAAMRAALDRALAATQDARDFLRGGVTFCALVPMRSIPFRVVALLGMNDDTFPRREGPVGFDLSAVGTRPGDRAAREDDRYTFLEALLSARERLLVTYVGQSIRNNAPLPPSVVVSELLDAIDTSFVSVPGTPAPRAWIEVRHPLQPFSPRYFEAGGDPRLFSYDAHAAAGARGLLVGGGPPPPRLDALPAARRAAGTVVTLEEMERFLEHPVRSFLQNRLGLYLGEDVPALDDREPLTLAGLARWHVGDALLARALAGSALDDALASVRAAGVLPPGSLGTWHLASIRPTATAIAGLAGPLVGMPRLGPVDVEVALGDIRLVGTLADLWPRAQVRPQYSRLAGRSEVRFWLRHLLLLLSAPAGYPRTTILLGRDPSTERPAVCRFDEVGDPAGVLAALAALYVRGLERVLPIFPGASRRYAETVHGGGTDASARALRKARNAFAGHVWGDRDDAYVRQVWGERTPFDERETETDFETLALALFGPLLAHRRASVGGSPI